MVAYFGGRPTRAEVAQLSWSASVAEVCAVTVVGAAAIAGCFPVILMGVGVWEMWHAPRAVRADLANMCQLRQLPLIGWWLGSMGIAMGIYSLDVFGMLHWWW